MYSPILQPDELIPPIIEASLKYEEVTGKPVYVDLPTCTPTLKEYLYYQFIKNTFHG